MATIALVLGGAASCVRARRPNVILVTLDTTRADRLGCYGGPVPTPALDRLAAEGVVFETAVTPLPSTPQAHASILTGLLPPHHGLLRVGQTLPAATPTLATILAANGYSRAAAVAAAILDPRFGLNRGFAEYLAPDHADALAADVQVGRAQEIVARARGPFFLWLHLYDPHRPYLPPDAYRDRFRDDPASARYGRDADAFRRETTDPVAEGRAPTPDELRLAMALYDGEVRFMDAELDALWDFLRARGLWDGALIVVTADHGESFRADYPFDHTDRLTEEIVRVPLIVKLPGARARARVRAPVDLTDILPTVLDVAGIPAPAGIDGRSLRPLWEGSLTKVRDGCFSEAPRTGNPRSVGSWVSWRDERFKLIHNLDRAEGALYPIAGTAVDERRDVCEGHVDDCRRYIGRALDLAERLGVGRRVAAPALDEETWERLRRLGYVR